MDLWWPKRFHPESTIAYLPFNILHEISCALSVPASSHSTIQTQLAEGPFFACYGSTIPLLAHRRVSFVLIRNLDEMRKGVSSKPLALSHANHFFAVVFDYNAHRAYSFGAFPRAKPTTSCVAAAESDWARWGGPGLWNNLANSLGWSDASNIDRVSVVSKDWKQVWNIPSLLAIPLMWPGTEWI